MRYQCLRYRELTVNELKLSRFLFMEMVMLCKITNINVFSAAINAVSVCVSLCYPVYMSLSLSVAPPLFLSVALSLSLCEGLFKFQLSELIKLSYMLFYQRALTDRLEYEQQPCDPGRRRCRRLIPHRRHISRV